MIFIVETPDDRDIIGHIENLLNEYNNKSLTDATEIQNAPDIIHRLEQLIHQSNHSKTLEDLKIMFSTNTTANDSKSLEDLKIMFSKIGVGGGKGGGSKVGGGGGSGGGTKTRIGGGFYRPFNLSGGGGGGGMTVLWVVVGMAGCAVVGYVFGVFMDYCKSKCGKPQATIM